MVKNHPFPDGKKGGTKFLFFVKKRGQVAFKILLYS